jgi:protein-S-isoprenylcysteine O-methyltransferase Ste14
MLSLDKVVFPPALALLCGVGISLLPRVDTLPFRPYITGLLAATAAYLHIDALLCLRRHKTEVSPFTPDRTSTIVREGVYGLSRNPMYLSLCVYLLAWSAWRQAPLGVLVAAAFVAYTTRFQVVPEERALGEKFGDEFEGYCKEVRRWI